VVLVAILAGRAVRLGQRNQWDEEDREDPLDTEYLVKVLAAALRTVEFVHSDTA
jgi:hypothetical protein